jgi:hypothetical protein
MKRTKTICSLLLLVGVSAAQAHRPNEGYVPNAETAVKIAEAVLIPVYGDKKIASERPFKAELKNGVWTVRGTLHCKDAQGKDTESCFGGAAEVQISKDDGRIIDMIHYK